MKILLIGEYIKLHWTFAKGLRQLGHCVVVASDGDGFKNYPRDIDMSLDSENRLGQIKGAAAIIKSLPLLKGFDIVQLINPMFTRIHHLNSYLYKYLKKNNGKIYLGAFGDDYFFTKACIENKIYRYSEFYVDGKPTNLKANKELTDAWIGTFRQRLNTEIAESCDGIIACLCEYFMAYEESYNDKLHFIPLPIDLGEIKFQQLEIPEVLKFFIGINKYRMEIKGSDIFLKVMKDIELKYGNTISVDIASSLPYIEYKERLSLADVVLDQIYSYSPAMNSLLSLAQGKVLVTNAVPEMYSMLHETVNQPIINISPEYKDIYTQIEKLILNKKQIPELSQNGRLFVEKHHNHVKVAKQYLNVWQCS
jgi:hypothetical protein